MSEHVTTTIECDECDGTIAEDQSFREIVYREHVAPPTPELPEDAPEDAPPPAAGPRMLTTEVTLHFHEDCFNRQTALKKERLDALIA